MVTYKRWEVFGMILMNMMILIQQFILMNKDLLIQKLFEDLNFENFDPKHCLDIQTRTGNGSIFWKKYSQN